MQCKGNKEEDTTRREKKGMTYKDERGQEEEGKA